MLPLQNIYAKERIGPASQKSAYAKAGKAKRRDEALGFSISDKSKVVFLDVETTGLSWFYDELTIVGWACDGSYRVLVSGDDPSELLGCLRDARTLVTFNGTLFDIRFLKKAFGEIVLPPTHIDLRYLAKRVGLSGGQKAIEKEIGLPDRVGFEEMSGAEAVVLWRKWIRGDEIALQQLIDYNRYDVFGMCGILDEVINRLDLHPDLLFSSPQYSAAELVSLVPVNVVATAAQNRRPERAAVTFDSLFGGTIAETATVVGIDLTGSEARPSGWCVLRGKKADTCTISTDKEMVARILNERPALVSIDSPLSMPFGRTQVEDSDPGRHEYGIMRRSERELKRRGINVYPCLLPSMQKLTKRGMELANILRSAGIPVIESYPGAAQDIMGIPRKGAGEQFLKLGLAEFGVDGEYQTSNVTHDELDAITSALVGSFFLAGKYEALRGPEENALIIPDLNAQLSGCLVVGFSGRICAGKTTASRFLEKAGFAYTRFSSVIDAEILDRGGLPNRETRQKIGAELHNQKGQAWLCEKVLAKVGNSKLIVIDGLRFPEDHAFFAERFGPSFLHVHLKAENELRAERFSGSEEKILSFEAADGQPVEGQIDQLGTLASINLVNEGTLAQLAEDVLNCVNSFAQRQGTCLFQ